jgi:CHAT domain-containing protein
MYRKSLEAYSKQADLLRDLGVRWGGVYEEARARYSIAVLAGYLFRDGTMERIEVVRLAEEALETAVRTGNRLMEANARLLVSSWLASGSAVEEAKRALALAREVGDRQVECSALRSLATRLLAADPQRPEQAFRLIDESIRDARSSGALEELARSLIARAAMRDRSGPRDAWLQASREALEGVERIRDLQPEGAMRARVFGPWAFAYYRFAGQLLAGEEASPDPPGDLDLAFSTIERMRARVLLEELEHAGARPDLDEANPDVRRRAEVLERISRVQKRLLNPTETDAGREAALAELDRLEAEEAALRDAIARAQPRFERLHPSSIADLAAVQARLAPDQALLSFQLPHEAPRDDDLFEEGGSWAVLVTRDRARAFPLPERGAIEDAVAVFLGLCRRRDGSEARAASRLFRDLLEAPLREAGDDVTKLILVPDGCLHRLPFAALRVEQDAPPLASRLELTTVPSATLWLRWKDGARAPSPSTVLALADPEIAAAAGGEGTPVANPWIERMSLGPLPRARHEARAFARALGRGSQVLFGADASESALKHAHLEDYGVLHLAAHAVVDDAHPERTAVVLAPGEGQEDGLLQLREIVKLPLEGRVVVLATCRSASGTEVEGEGVLGLARGFFQAGARVVVGTLWPVRDEDAEAFVEPFARELGRGRSVSSAHAAAVREASLSGAPTAAWAGMVVIGDGDLVPLPAPRGYALGFPRWLLLVAGLALALFYAALMVRRLAR